MAVSSAVEKRTDDKANQKEQLGGARADFVANLGRRRAEISAALDLLRAAPTATRHRDDLRRRVHALGAGARLLRFGALADELKRLEEYLDEAAARGALDESDLDHTADVLAKMASLAWSQTGTRTAIEGVADPEQQRAPASTDPRQAPVSVLVVGKQHFAEALQIPAESNVIPGVIETPFEIEHVDETAAAADVARAFAPDLILVDGDLKGSLELIEELLTDSLTESIPVVVAGRFAKSEDVGRLVALGVARTLPKPVSPGEIRRACANVVSSYVKREIVREPIGSVNVDQLGARLAEEMRKGLSDVDGRLRDRRVDLGDGTEIFAALWGAVARIRDVMTIKSAGAVRFQTGGPEGAMPLAPWLGGQEGPAEGARSLVPRSARAATDVSLQKVRVVVADDDPAVTWFLAGVLKAAGATVYEARDGERALEIAKHSDPDLVISDILMPKLDGFGLTRALKRDLVLRDVPIVLLSWKEDLLQRVRELGADADAYLRKEASAGAVVQRVRELLRQRKRVSDRIRSGGEVRGRLDGLTTATLLRMVAEARPNSTVSVRDALYLYEVELRDGRPARVTRTSTTGNFERGASVLSALLGAGDGRFVVAPAREDQEVAKVRADLTGSLSEQLAPMLATARAAQRLLGGANLVRVQKVGFDEERLGGYRAATPEPAKKLLGTLAGGASPRALLTRGEIAPRLLEDVLIDVAAHGIVIEVVDLTGVDRLPEATQHELAILRGERAAQPIASIPLLNMPVMTPAPSAALEVSLPPQALVIKAALARESVTGAPPAVAPSAPVVAQPTALIGDPLTIALGGLGPSSEELAQGSPTPLDLETESALDSAEEEPSPPPSSGPRLVTPPPPVHTLSLGDDTTKSARTPTPKPVAVHEPTPTPSKMPPPPGLKPMLTLGSLHPPPVMPASPPPAPATHKKNEKTKTPKPAPVAKTERELTPSAPFVDKRAEFMPSRFMPPRVDAPKPKDHKALYWVLFAMLGVGFAVWARWRNHNAAEDALVRTAVDSAAVESSAEPESSSSAAPVADDDAAAPKSSASAAKEQESPPEDLPLRDYDKVKKGQGMLEVVAGKNDTIYIDGKPRGSGPVQGVALKAKDEPYEVRVKMRGEERVRFVTVKDGRLTRLRVAPPWTR